MDLFTMLFLWALLAVIPVKAYPVPAADAPKVNNSAIYAVLAVAVILPIAVLCIGLYLYRRKTGHLPRWFNHKPVAAPVIVPERRHRAGVWRSTQEHGLPGYTVQAKIGELSLGTGRKRTDEEDYELSDRRNSDQTSLRTESHERQNSAATILELEEPEDTTEVAAENVAKPEALPPYIPPPAPATSVVADTTGRRGSSSSRLSIRISGNGNPPRRISFPRAVVPSQPT